MILASLPVNFSSKYEPQVRATLSQKSTKVEVHFVISSGYVNYNILFPNLSTVRVPTSTQIVTFGDGCHASAK